MKKPSLSTIKLSKSIKAVFGLGQNMLYQLVSLAKGSPSYPSSNPFNSQWDEYNPYKPSKETFQGYYKSMTNSPWGTPPPRSASPYNFAQDKTTLHAVPFLRDNIQPTTFSVKKTAKSYENDLRMFINFPTGLPLRLG